MRSHVLTELEVKLIQSYLRNDRKFDGFAVLIHRIRTNLQSLKEQIALIEQTLEKVANEP